MWTGGGKQVGGVGQGAGGGGGRGGRGGCVFETCWWLCGILLRRKPRW